MEDPYVRRRLELLHALYERTDGVLENAAIAIGRDPSGRVFEMDKRTLIEEGAMEQVVVPPGMLQDEFYAVTAVGVTRLRDARLL